MFNRTPSFRSGSQPTGCSCRALPAHVDVVWRLAFEDRFELALQLKRRRQASLRTGYFVARFGPLTLDPVLA